MVEFLDFRSQYVPFSSSSSSIFSVECGICATDRSQPLPEHEVAFHRSVPRGPRECSGRCSGQQCDLLHWHSWWRCVEDDGHWTDLATDIRRNACCLDRCGRRGSVEPQHNLCRNG